MRRVVVTGLGLVTPLADGVEASWSRILDGQSGAGTITGFDAEHLATNYACEVPLGDGSDGTFNADGNPLTILIWRCRVCIKFHGTTTRCAPALSKSAL